MKIHNIFNRKQNSYKNNFGHVLIIAGSYNMPGAGVLCANSAITSGAGLVTFVFPKSAYPVIAQNIKPEIMLLPLEEKNGTFSKSAHNKIIKFIEKRKITSVAIGCGMGKSFCVKNLILSIIKKFDIYVIIDADGLNSLENKQKKAIIKEFQNAKSKIIVTPHPKEFERTSKIKYKEDPNYRKEITKTFAKNNDIICVLKGHKTVVSDGNKIYINNTGNAGMATAGSGDVLTGIVSAFVCIENKDLLLKVATAVYVHGLAGDFAAKEKTQVSITASDIIDNIFKAIKKLQSNFFWRKDMNLFKTLQNIRRTIHQNPELSTKEFKTADLVEKILKEQGIKTYRLCKTGVIGILEGTKKTNKKTKTIALRADLDALPIKEKNNHSYKSKNPGVMHACGHDGNTTMLLGAAMILAKQKDEFAGKIQFTFQLDEETAGGSKGMIKEGVLSKNKVDCILGAHVSPWAKTGKVVLKYGAMMAGVDKFVIEIKGLLGHGAYPHLSKDPIVATSEFIMSLQTIPSRIINPVEPIVVTVGKVEGGQQYNIIADKVTITGTVRTFNEKTRDIIKKEMIKRLQGICKSYSMTYTLDYQILNNPLINTDSVVDLCFESAKQVYGEKDIELLKNPSMAGEDFAEYLKEIKGAFVYIGTSSNEKTSYPWHHEKFDLDETALPKGAEYLANTAKFFLNK